MSEWKIIKIDKENATPLWVEAENGRWNVTVKWDGCIEFRERPEYYPTPVREVASFHICDIDEFIKLLQDLRDNVEKEVVW